MFLQISPHQSVEVKAVATYVSNPSILLPFFKMSFVTESSQPHVGQKSQEVSKATKHSSGASWQNSAAALVVPVLKLVYLGYVLLFIWVHYKPEHPAN